MSNVEHDAAAAVLGLMGLAVDEAPEVEGEQPQAAAPEAQEAAVETDEFDPQALLEAEDPEDIDLYDDEETLAPAAQAEPEEYTEY